MMFIRFSQGTKALMISNSVISHCSIGTSEICRLLWNWHRLVYLKRRWFMEWDELKVHIVER